LLAVRLAKVSRTERVSGLDEELPRLRRMPAEAHLLEPLDRLLDQPVVRARETQRSKGERLEVGLRPQDRRRHLLDLPWAAIHERLAQGLQRAEHLLGVDQG